MNLQNLDLQAALQSILNTLSQFAVTVGGKLIFALLVFIIGRIIIKLVIKGIKKSRAAKHGDPTVITFLCHAVRISLYVILVITIISILGVPISSLIAVLASAGVAIGLALQGSLSNLAGGIMVLIFHPFKLDDFVEIDGCAGTVSDVGIFYTTLTTGDNRTITIPNGTVMDSNIINNSRKETRRVDMTFDVAYGTDVEKAKRVILDYIGSHELILKEKEPFCRLTSQTDSAMIFTGRVWVNAGDYWQVKFDLTEGMLKRFEEEGIEVPFNQLDVHIVNQ